MPKDIAAEVEQRVIAIAAEQAGRSPKDITLATHFVNDLSFDSLDAVEFVMETEEEFDIQIADAEADNIQTVEQAVTAIVAKLTPVNPLADDASTKPSEQSSEQPAN